MEILVYGSDFTHDLIDIQSIYNAAGNEKYECGNISNILNLMVNIYKSPVGILTFISDFWLSRKATFGSISSNLVKR